MRFAERGGQTTGSLACECIERWVVRSERWLMTADRGLPGPRSPPRWIGNPVARGQNVMRLVRALRGNQTGSWAATLGDRAPIRRSGGDR
jgi:hypothetical protein